MKNKDQTPTRHKRPHMIWVFRKVFLDHTIKNSSLSSILSYYIYWILTIFQSEITFFVFIYLIFIYILGSVIPNQNARFMRAKILCGLSL